MKKALHILAALLCAASCIYPYDPDVEQAPEGVLAVEGDILVGGVSTIRLGLMASLYPDASRNAGGGESRGLGDAKAWIEDDAGTVYEGTRESADEVFGDGRSPFLFQYTFPTGNAPGDRKYRVCIEALGARYASDWTLPLEAPSIRSIDFRADGFQVTVNVSLDGGAESTGYALLSYDETWEFHTEYALQFEVDTLSWIVQKPLRPVQQPNYWCWKHQDARVMYPVDFTGRTENGVTDYPLLSFPRTNNRNHRRYCVNVKARTITKDTYRYLHNLDEVAGGGSDLFTPNPGEIQGNIRCETDPERMALGYVTTSMLSVRRAFLDGRYYRVPQPNYAALAYIIPNDYPQYYQYGYLPLIENPHTDYDPRVEGGYGWGGPRCYDCVADGGTKEIPEHWYEDAE